MATGKASGKKKGECPKSGCIKKVGSNWRVVSNKTGKIMAGQVQVEGFG